MAALPVINILATIHLYCHLRAYHRAGSAPGAFLAFVECRGQIASRVQFIREGDQLFGTEGDAELAPLAQFLVYFYFTLHLFACLFMILIKISHAGFSVKDNDPGDYSALHHPNKQNIKIMFNGVIPNLNWCIYTINQTPVFVYFSKL